MSGKHCGTAVQIRVEELSELSCSELCGICHVDLQFIEELIAHGILEPHGSSIQTWRFNLEHLRVVRMAMHLQRDLELNHAGIALAIDLMSQIKMMHQQIDILEKFFSTLPR